MSNLSGLTGNLDINNDGQIILAGGESENVSNTRAIKGAGNVSFDGYVNNNAAITQTSIENTGSLTTNADNIDAVVNNAGEYVVTGGTIAKNVNNITVGETVTAGKTVIDGTGVVLGADINNTVEINANKDLSANADNLKNTISNDGTLTLNGGTLDYSVSELNTAGDGTVEIKGDVVIGNGSINNNNVQLTSGSLDVTNIADSDGNIDLSGATSIIGGDAVLNVQDGLTGEINLGTVNASTASPVKVAIDSNFAALESDILKADSVTGAISIDNLYVTADPASVDFSINVADDSTKANVTIANMTVTNLGASIGSLLYSYDTETGDITANHSDLSNAIISSVTQKAYAMSGDESINGALDLGGTSLSITGNNNSITSNTQGNDGITVTDNTQTLTINNAAIGSATTGFGTAVNNSVGAIVNLNNVTMSGNIVDVLNNGEDDKGVFLTGTNNIGSIVDSAQTGVQGQTTITSGETTVGTLKQKSLSIKEGGKLNASLANLSVTNSISNEGEFALTGGSADNHAVNSKDITGEGSVSFAGYVDNTANIEQETITNTGVLASDASDLNAGQSIVNKGTLELTNGSLTSQITSDESTSKTVLSNVTLDGAKLGTDTTNLGSVEINTGNSAVISGTLSKDIAGEGTVQINNTTDDKTLTLAEGVDIAGTLDLNNSVLDLIIPDDTTLSAHNVGNIKGNGDLKIAADMDSAISDGLIVTGTNSDGTLNLTTVHVKKEHSSPIADGTDYLTYVQAGESGSIENINFTLDNDSIISYTTNYKYTFVKGSDGKLSLALEHSSTSLADYISGVTTGGSSFDVTEDTLVESNGEWAVPTNPAFIAGDGNVLDINLNGYKLSGDGVLDGISVGSAYTMTLDGSPAVAGDNNSVISDFATAVINEGVLNASDLTFDNNTVDIANSGTLNLSGTNVINDGISGITVHDALTETDVTTLGTINISGGTTTVKEGVSVNQETINVLTGAELNANPTDILAEIANSGVVNLTEQQQEQLRKK